MKRRKFSVFTLIIAILVFLFNYISDNYHKDYDVPITNEKLVVKFFDIEHGDSILIKNEQETILIDTGDVGTKNKLIELLKKEKIEKIDVLIATHPHADHIGGIEEVIKTFRIGKILDSGQVHTTKIFKDYLNLVKKKNIPFVKAVKGNIYKLSGGASLEVLWPKEKLLTNTNSDLNNNSIVVKFTKKNIALLLVGDIEKEAESILVKENSDKLKSTILKAPHHGSKTSSTDAFLKAVGAKTVVISCGTNNDYNLPHKQVIDRYKKYNMETFITKDSGNITIVSDGEKYKVIKER